MHESRITPPCKTIFPSPGRVHGNPIRVWKNTFSPGVFWILKSTLKSPPRSNQWVVAFFLKISYSCARQSAIFSTFPFRPLQCIQTETKSNGLWQDSSMHCILLPPSGNFVTLVPDLSTKEYLFHHILSASAQEGWDCRCPSLYHNHWKFHVQLLASAANIQNTMYQCFITIHHVFTAVCNHLEGFRLNSSLLSGWIRYLVCIWYASCCGWGMVLHTQSKQISNDQELI